MGELSRFLECLCNTIHLMHEHLGRLCSTGMISQGAWGELLGCLVPGVSCGCPVGTASPTVALCGRQRWGAVQRRC